MPAVRPLTIEEFDEAALLAMKAEAARYRLGRGLTVTLPMSVQDSWIELGRQIQSGLWRLEDASWEQHRRLISEPAGRLFGPATIPWFDAVRARGNHKRLLGRSEWVALGEEYKELRGHLAATGAIVSKAYRDEKRCPWPGLVKRADRRLARILRAVRGQHPRWGQETAAFVGPRLAENPELAATVDVAEVEAIRTMDEAAAEAFRHLDPARPHKAARHYSEVLPLASLETRIRRDSAHPGSGPLASRVAAGNPGTA